MSNVMQDANATKHSIVFLPFQTTDMPDAAGTYKTLQATSNEYRMPWAGSIVGISAAHNADLTGGTVTHRATIGGTASALLTCATDDTHQSASAAIEGRKLSFAAGALIGMDWTKTGTVAPITTDVTAGLWVLLENIDL